MNKSLVLIATVFLFSLSISCNKTVTEKNNHKHYDKLFCEFISLDAFKPELGMRTASFFADGTVEAISMGLQLKTNENDYLNKYRIGDELTVSKESKLRDELNSYRFYYDVGVDTHWKIIYAGISGTVRVYADETVDGRSAGNDLSDLFEVAVRGIVNYPEMELLKDEHQSMQSEAEYYRIGFNDYFFKGVVPFATDYDTYLYAKGGYNYLLDGTRTIHIEIPVTGISSEGKEISMVLTSIIP